MKNVCPPPEVLGRREITSHVGGRGEGIKDRGEFTPPSLYTPLTMVKNPVYF